MRNDFKTPVNPLKYKGLNIFTDGRFIPPKGNHANFAFRFADFAG